MLTCGTCRFMCPPNRCFKHPYQGTWAFRHACDDHMVVLGRYAAVTTTTAPKSWSYTTKVSLRWTHE